MNYRQHYTEALRLLDACDEWDSTDPSKQWFVDNIVAQAQVHATLALALATIGPLAPPLPLPARNR